MPNPRYRFWKCATTVVDLSKVYVITTIDTGDKVIHIHLENKTTVEMCCSDRNFAQKLIDEMSEQIKMYNSEESRSAPRRQRGRRGRNTRVNAEGV